MTRAIRIHEFGDSGVLRQEDVPTPEPGPGEMLVRVHAAGINPVDYKIRQGGYPAVGEDDLPITMGLDVSGVVEAVGDAVDSFTERAAVHAMLSRPGGYAEHAIVRAEEAAAVPRELNHEQAAAVPLAALTAWQGLLEQGGLQAGQTVLIHGGAGGVGHFAVQIAKAHGAEVVVTAGQEDVPLLTDLGADRVVDYRSQRFEDEVGEVDLVLDLIGGETQERSWAVLKRGGAMVSTLQDPSKERAREKDARTGWFLVSPNGTQLEEIDRLVMNGQLRPVVMETLPLDRAAEAHDRLEHEHSRGKIVLTVP